MADEDWLSEATADTPAEAPSNPEGNPEAAPEGDIIADPLEEEEDDFPTKGRIRTDRPLLFKYWKRPVRLQYAYLYDYRHNYYDDVIDYLDRRQRGISRDIPRAQTWAERALRTYSNRNKTTEDYHKRENDITLLSDIRTSNRFYRYHSKEYINQRYSSFL